MTEKFGTHSLLYILISVRLFHLMISRKTLTTIRIENVCILRRRGNKISLMTEQTVYNKKIVWTMQSIFFYFTNNISGPAENFSLRYRLFLIIGEGFGEVMKGWQEGYARIIPKSKVWSTPSLHTGRP